jgi:hypothetical protein
VATLGWITLTLLQKFASQIQKGGKKKVLSGKMWQQKTNPKKNKQT